MRHKNNFLSFIVILLLGVLQGRVLAQEENPDLVPYNARPASSTKIPASQAISLDSCRSMAISNNKGLLISSEKISAAKFRKSAAFTHYLPELSATGAYMRTQKEISLLSDSRKSAMRQAGTATNAQLQEFAQAVSALYPDLVPLISSLGNVIAEPLNDLGNSLADALRTDTRNVYTGAITLIQPLYMGGKIRAYNNITKYAEELAHSQYNSDLQELILSADQAYWQVVSLANKKKIAESYIALLRKMDDDMEKMFDEGLVTRADVLSVKVKVNEAEMTLVKVDDGLSLSRMILCQLCGLEINSSIVLVDEGLDDISMAHLSGSFSMEDVYAGRPEIRSLKTAIRIQEEQVNVTRSGHMPSLSLSGNYLLTNPSMFNGFEKELRGMWSVGVMIRIPVWNWGEGAYNVKIARTETNIARYKLDEAKEKIELQVKQSIFKVEEAMKKLDITTKNMDRADENLRHATLGFREGVIPAANLLEAQTAWMAANSERIDARIDVKMTETYLMKALGLPLRNN